MVLDYGNGQPLKSGSMDDIMSFCISFTEKVRLDIKVGLGTRVVQKVLSLIGFLSFIPGIF